MINEPIACVTDGFQEAWLEVVRRLMTSAWTLRNLVVQVRHPDLFDDDFHNRICDFATQEKLLGPRHVAYTIFPQGLYRGTGEATRVFDAYNRENGWYERAKKKTPWTWGTYFRRMTHYELRNKVIVNQLGRVIDAINSRQSVHRAAYTVVLQKPGGETARTMGGPCLNYIAIQIEAGNPNSLGLLAVYRNHDFLKRAYGNYWGLCNLLQFLASETNCSFAPLTCVSSHAYVGERKTALKALVEDL
ncbi:MAG: hypothetical protein ACLQPD_31875 [Desulfomonilaceae bacterium]